MESEEEIIKLLVAIPLLLLTIIGFVIILYSVMKIFIAGIFEPVFVKVFHSSPFFHFSFSKKELPKNLEIFLMQHFKYYRNLPEKMQKNFAHRVVRFIEQKKFHGREGLEVNDRMKVLIAAAAIKLTFGLRKYLLNSFPHIILYPGTFYSRFTQTHNKGETNARGIIVLSWEDFLEGYRDENDNLNVGLHEFAHALSLQYKINRRASDSNFNYWYYQWETSMNHPRVYNAVLEKQFFREYAGANRMELFAVAVETFFESPESFKSELPGIFKMMSKMLNQHPA